jgi:hypothetical protein
MNRDLLALSLAVNRSLEEIDRMPLEEFLSLQLALIQNHKRNDRDSKTDRHS